MEPNVVLSVGSLIGLFGLFYAWHKDAKSTSNQITALENKVNYLDEKLKQQDSVIERINETLIKMDLKLTRIDTQLSLLLEEKRDRQQNVS